MPMSASSGLIESVKPAVHIVAISNPPHGCTHHATDSLHTACLEDSSDAYLNNGMAALLTQCTGQPEGFVGLEGVSPARANLLAL